MAVSASNSCSTAFARFPAFTRRDAETASGATLLWRIPNQYFAVSRRDRPRRTADAAESHRNRALL